MRAGANLLSAPSVNGVIWYGYHAMPGNAPRSRQDRRSGQGNGQGRPDVDRVSMAPSLGQGGGGGRAPPHDPPP